MAAATTLGPVPLMPVPARLRFGVDVPDPKFSPPPARRQSDRRGELLTAVARRAGTLKAMIHG